MYSSDAKIPPADRRNPDDFVWSFLRLRVSGQAIPFNGSDAPDEASLPSFFNPISARRDNPTQGQSSSRFQVQKCQTLFPRE
jgi:hypothetical protein